MNRHSERPTPYPPPFDTDEGRKTIPSLMHPIIHQRYAFFNIAQIFFTSVDSHIYSDQFRTMLAQKLQQSPTLTQYLQSSEATREHVYRFFVKGSNVYTLVEKYLENKYNLGFERVFPRKFLSDWDSTVLINPFVSQDEYTIIFYSLVEVLLTYMMEFSRQLSNDPDYAFAVPSALHDAFEKLSVMNIEKYNKFKYKFNETKSVPLKINGMKEPFFTSLSNSLGVSGQGTLVTSNTKPFEEANFYLARVMANVIAGRRIQLPVELIDVSIPYLGDELKFSWESSTEYHIQYKDYNYRISSPVSLYMDLAKSIRDEEQRILGTTQRDRNRKSKLPQRLERITKLLKKIIVPYSQTNIQIQRNLNRHMKSHTNVGRIGRTLKRYVGNPQSIQIRGSQTVYGTEVPLEDISTADSLEFETRMYY